ncbi:hypothetical protein C3L33_11836, partial [Rhododendron williamsianum]
MDALWNLEDKWKITTQKAVFAFTCTAFLVCGICIAAAIRRRARRRQLVSQEPSKEDQAQATKRLEPQLLRPGSCGLIKRVLTGSVRWSNARKWGERGSSRSRRERAAPLLVGRGREREVGWQSHNSMAPVWQRPILMGEKCELPRFSGLILYDERGTPVHSSGIGTTDHHQSSYGNHGQEKLSMFRKPENGKRYCSILSRNYDNGKENYTQGFAIGSFVFRLLSSLRIKGLVSQYQYGFSVGELGPYFVCRRRFGLWSFAIASLCNCCCFILLLLVSDMLSRIKISQVSIFIDIFLTLEPVAEPRLYRVGAKPGSCPLPYTTSF